MCFVWISEQTAIISLYSINWLVCITETECVYCAVRTEYLYITLRVLSQFRYSIASLSPRWPRFNSRPAHTICGGIVALDRFISEYFGFPPSYDSTKCSKLIFIYTWLSSDGNRGGAWGPSKNAFSEMAEHQRLCITHRLYSFYMQHSATGLPSYRQQKCILCEVKI